MRSIESVERNKNLMRNGEEFMKRRNFLLSSMLLSFKASSLPVMGQETTQDRPPNVLLIFADQMRGQAMGCMGNPDVITPYLDRLASEGILFPDTFSNTPVCCPARACLLTGKYTHKHGLVANDLRLRESEVTIAEIMAKNGYRTGFIGKWHLDGGARQPGFVPPGPRRQGFQFWAANQCSHEHFDTHYFHDSPEPIAVKKFEPEAWTDEAINFLQSNQDQPFFLTVAMGPPHDPYDAPEEYKSLYDPEKLEMRPNWVEGIKNAGRNEIAKYYAAITAIDDQVGRLLATLDELNLAEDTIVLFTSDHGDMLGSHGLRLKRKPWEESILVPGILRYPRKVQPSQMANALFSWVDIAPTLLSLCGIAPGDDMQGSDLSQFILGKKLGENANPPSSVFFQIFGPYHQGGVTEGWRGVRTMRYMYARTEEKPWVLYDLRTDPYEMNNLVDNDVYAEVLSLMEKKLQDWMSKTEDSWAYNWSEPVEDAGRLYRHGTFYTVDEYLAWARENPDRAR